MKFLLYYFAFLFLFLSLLCSGVIDSQDGFQYLAVARNIYYKGQPISPPYEYTTGKNIHMSVYTGKDGRDYSPTGLGYSLAMLPSVALTDLVYKYYHLDPPIHFPLENDWLILLLASFTNIFFTAGLGVTMFLYFTKFNLTKKQAFFMSLITLFSTNIFVYSKSSFANMMFTTFLVLSFFLLKEYSLSKRKVFLVASGLSYGVTALSYNQAFLITLIPYILYYFLVTNTGIRHLHLKLLLKNSFFIFMGFLPFWTIYVWFESIRAFASGSIVSTGFFTDYASNTFRNFPISLFFEGIWGQLLSPGRSLFLYSPILLTIIFFWHKIRSNVKPELVTFLILALGYIPFFAAQHTFFTPEQGITGLWHGESSWGSRYLIILIPFGLLVIGSIFQSLSKIQKYLIFYPLIIIGFYIEILSIVMPYQIKFHDLEGSFTINGTEFTNYTYSNLLPRYSPVLMMSKKLAKLIISFPKTLDHGIYNVRFYDGITFPFNVGSERWRSIDNKGYISFDNLKKEPIKKISLGLINHPIATSSSSAKLQFTLNGHLLLEKPLEFISKERKIVEIPISNQLLKEKNNQLVVDDLTSKEDDKDFVISRNRNLILTKEITQILGILSFSINDHVVNMESLDSPYVSNLGPAMVGATYQNYGGLNKDPWRLWEIHTQIYERTPNFWWMKTLYYWDYPKKTFSILFILTLAGTIFFAVKTLTYLKRLK